MSIWLAYEKMDAWGPSPLMEIAKPKPVFKPEDLTGEEVDDLYTVQAIFKLRASDDWDEMKEAALVCRLKSDAGCKLAGELFSEPPKKGSVSP